MYIIIKDNKIIQTLSNIPCQTNEFPLNEDEKMFNVDEDVISGQEIVLEEVEETIQVVIGKDEETGFDITEEQNVIVEKVKEIKPYVPHVVIKTPPELRREAYQGLKIISWNENLITVDEAKKIFYDYFPENNAKAEEIKTLITQAKTEIREMYPDN